MSSNSLPRSEFAVPRSAFVPRHGGLILSKPSRPVRSSVPSSSPLRDGPDVSWLHRCQVGDNQGSDGACAIFALASWAEIMHGRHISDRACLDLYAATLRHLGRDDVGLTFGEAFAAAHGAGWLAGARAILRADDLSALAQQPIIAGYSITAAWDRVSPQGCLDHAAPLQPVRGYHAVVIVAHGELTNLSGGPWVYIENSWGLSWGWRGLGVMSEALHNQLIGELWTIV